MAGQDSQAVLRELPEWVRRLQQEIPLAPMKNSYWLTRDEVAYFLAALQSQQVASTDRGEAVWPAEVHAWIEARREHRRLVAIYNARVQYARDHAFGYVSCDPEYQAMCVQQRVLREATEAAANAIEATPPSPSADPESERRLRDGIMPPHRLDGIVPAAPSGVSDAVRELRRRIEAAWHNHDESGRVVITMRDAMMLVEEVLPQPGRVEGSAKC